MTSVRLHFWIESDCKAKGEREGKERKKEGRKEGETVFMYTVCI